MSGKNYRPCVVAAFVNEKNELLVGKRKHLPAAWQLPQGGIEEGEDPQKALFREVKEEIGIEHFEILASSKEPYFYDFPKDASFDLSKKFSGQKQYWFLCKIVDNFLPDLEKAIDDEFDEITWMPSKDLLNQIIHWKKEVYYKALLEFSLID